MKKWVQKAVVQKIIAYLPFSNNINFLFQKYITKGVNLSDDYFFDRLGHARDHLNSFNKYSTAAFPHTCLEIGTGWYPIVPISLFLVGSERIYSVDISFLTSKKRIYTIIQKILTCYESGELNAYVKYLPERITELQQIAAQYEQLSLKQLLEKLHINYLIEDARNLSIADNSVDLVNSNNTFEHIYPNILVPILKEFKRIIKKQEGVMSHFIDMSDHFAHFDKSITIYHFLRFSDKKWQLIDNSVQPQSRLRMYEYEQLFADLHIPITEHTFREGNLAELETIPLAEKFVGIAKKDLAISHCHFISKMADN